MQEISMICRNCFSFEDCKKQTNIGGLDSCSKWQPPFPLRAEVTDLPTALQKQVGGDHYELLGQSIGALVDEKQAAYGDSFGKSGDFLKILYPDGIKPDQYGDALTVVRIFDKLMRIATDKDALGESPYRDIAGYGILGAAKGESN